MLGLYKFAARLIHMSCYPYGRIQADRGSLLWKGRLGLTAGSGPNDIWLHAASVGEVRVISYLVDFLLHEEPSLRIHITAMTKAGFAMALKLFTQDNFSLSYFPFDSPAIVRRTLDAVKPRMLVLAETEIWPNLITEAADRKIPVLLVNARMSEKAFGKYKLIRRSLGKLLRTYDHFFFKTDGDAERYKYFGIEPERVSLAGDMKFDAPLLERSEGRRRQIRERAGIPADAFVIVAGSTRPGEEAILLDVFDRLGREKEGIALVIAPRHVERFDEIAGNLRERGIAFGVYGEPNGGANVVLVDRVGVLNDLYLAADVSFVGGTLVDIGGHNILEPVWAGCPVFFGPSLDNVRDAAQYITESNYGAMVADADELYLRLKNVADGDTIYSVKESIDTGHSPTVMAGRYILERLRNA